MGAHCSQAISADLSPNSWGDLKVRAHAITWRRRASHNQLRSEPFTAFQMSDWRKDPDFIAGFFFITFVVTSGCYAVFAHKSGEAMATLFVENNMLPIRALMPGLFALGTPLLLINLVKFMASLSICGLGVGLGIFLWEKRR